MDAIGRSVQLDRRAVAMVKRASTDLEELGFCMLFQLEDLPSWGGCDGQVSAMAQQSCDGQVSADGTTELRRAGA